MGTIVYQSFRTHDVPEWTRRCLTSVRSWAARRGYAYRFFDDAFFEFAPDWYREKCGHDVLLVTDLCRLVAARRLLDEGFERVVWVDADVLVLNPDRFVVGQEDGYTLCHEVWLERDASGQLQVQERVNNAVCVFARGNTFLDFYVDTAMDLVRHSPALNRWSVGTVFLSMLAQVMPLRVRRDVAMISPALLMDAATPERALLRSYRDRVGGANAANVCGSTRGSAHGGSVLDDAVFERALDGLEAVFRSV